eukprot:1710930-Amphidinium_carterae.1
MISLAQRFHKCQLLRLEDFFLRLFTLYGIRTASSTKPVVIGASHLNHSMRSYVWTDGLHHLEELLKIGRREQVVDSSLD